MGDVDFDEHTQIEYERRDHTAEYGHAIHWIGAVLPDGMRQPQRARADTFTLTLRGDTTAGSRETHAATYRLKTQREFGFAREYRIWVSHTREVDHERCRLVDHGHYDTYRALFWVDEATATRLRQDERIYVPADGVPVVPAWLPEREHERE